MKKIIYVIVCMMLFGSACSDSDTESNPSGQAKQQVTLTFSPGEACTRMAADETRIGDINLYLFPSNGSPAWHLYIAPLRSVVLELPKGDYTLYAVANAETDLGEQTRDYIRTLRFEQDPDTPADGPFPMSAEQTVTVSGDTKISVSLVRAVTKVNFSYTVAAEFAPELEIKSVRICNAPCSMSLFATSRATTSGDVADTNPDADPGHTFSASYYLLENRQGTVAGIGSQNGKNQSVAPEFATYIYIEGEADGVKVAYRIYPGENNTTDFNIVRNRVYNIDARILGMNTVDWRVSTAEVAVTPLAENYGPGASAAATLELVSTNDVGNDFYLSYHLDAGQGVVTIDGESRTADTPYPLLSGSGTATAEIAYMQDVPGDVLLRLTVTDKYGFSMERELATSYTEPKLAVTFMQEGTELAAEDRAYIDFTISQPGYTGSYTATIYGTPFVFYGRYGSDIPVKTLTIPGNGTYTLRVKPALPGPNPLKITVTDTNGNSESFMPSIAGVKTTAVLKPSFSVSGSFFDVIVESSYPVSDDLTLKIAANAEFYSYGGSVTKKQYIVTLKIEAGQTSGRGSVALNYSGNYATFSVASYSGEYQHTSNSGLVLYQLQ